MSRAFIRREFRSFITEVLHTSAKVFRSRWWAIGCLLAGCLQVGMWLVLLGRTVPPGQLFADTRLEFYSLVIVPYLLAFLGWVSTTAWSLARFLALGVVIAGEVGLFLVLFDLVWSGSAGVGKWFMLFVMLPQYACGLVCGLSGVIAFKMWLNSRWRAQL